ncbi:hypothetical protein [Pseudomonas corrugata]|uniref:hypothetical protein n=1 Tax=Pseudomonas corrugata TaxID=47879 RepID=UPI0028C376B0|nr:hypothetical protein [Pseudomonas corrugata]MDU9024252.1 hypothetical protein [Pseudomonas corrugata]
MLDRSSAEVGTIETTEDVRDELSDLERRLISYFRRLSKREQDHLRKLTEVLGAHPEHTEND